MNRYIYALIGIEAVSGTLLLAGAKISSAGTADQSPATDMTSVNSDFGKDAIEWEVQMDGWHKVASQGKLNNPAYLVVLSNDISSISNKISTYQRLYAGSGN